MGRNRMDHHAGMSGGQFIRLLAVWAAAFGGLTSTAGASALSGEPAGSANIIIGEKFLDSEEWDPVEFQDLVGGQVTIGRTTWPVALEVDFLHTNEESKSDSGIVRGHTEEWGVGIRKVWAAGPRRVYVGGGGALLKARVSLPATGRKDHDGAFGPWVDGGGVLEDFRLLRAGILRALFIRENRPFRGVPAGRRAPGRFHPGLELADFRP